jgi:hypothetical protein
MSSRILIGNYAIKLATDGKGSPVWTATDRRTARLVVVDGQPLEFDEQAEAEKWAREPRQALKAEILTW